jgi:hypothetical protein
LLTSFSRPNVTVPPYTAVAAGEPVAAPPVVPVPGAPAHAPRTRASVVRIASERVMHTLPDPPSRVAVEDTSDWSDQFSQP